MTISDRLAAKFGYIPADRAATLLARSHEKICALTTEVQMLETQIVTLRAKLARPKVRGLRNVPLRGVENV